eukprot:Protomagalhaensia_sp_Gyna_25__500@NODE_1237_length_2037_cov_5_688689_g987_i0_p1_GENE_NODE_1237_length_2037_cov_5_688689_g987_i0NODE_1237_length_2037_cov_5_688689_g987_i0_p1_ORF_typecomplete_len418_score56_78_NODE_1237_length_2037_cov_5_688689_g987_i05661819
MLALRLLNRAFVQRQRLACHDALSTLHRNMWLVRDEQWEGYAGEAEAYYLQKAKAREGELVAELAAQEEELQETQEALRIVLRGYISAGPPAPGRVLPIREPGQPTQIPAVEAIRDLRTRLKVPGWSVLSDSKAGGSDTLNRSLLALSRQVQAVSFMAVVTERYGRMTGLKKAFNKWRRLTVNKKKKVSPQCVAACLIFASIAKQLQRKLLVSGWKALNKVEPVESSSRNFSAVSLVTVPARRPRPEIINTSLPATSLTSTGGRRGPPTARSLSPPQFHSRNETALLTRGSSGDLFHHQFGSPNNATLFTLTDAKRGVRPSVLGYDSARQPPFRRQVLVAVWPLPSKGGSATETAGPAFRPAALQTQRLPIYSNQPVELQKPRALPPAVRLPMYDWSQPQPPPSPPAIRNHLIQTWR